MLAHLAGLALLFLGPSLVECVVTLVLFFAHFKSPELSATALISFTICTHHTGAPPTQDE